MRGWSALPEEPLLRWNQQGWGRGGREDRNDGAHTQVFAWGVCFSFACAARIPLACFPTPASISDTLPFFLCFD